MWQRCTTGPFISGIEHRAALCRASSPVPSTLYPHHILQHVADASRPDLLDELSGALVPALILMYKACHRVFQNHMPWRNPPVGCQQLYEALVNDSHVERWGDAAGSPVLRAAHVAVRSAFEFHRLTCG
jgi:hypothetical protein